MMAQYKGAAFGELSPHPFAVADAAYRQMINEGISQSILVSGESGAGKTESTKLLMRYLAYMGGRAVSEGRTVEQQVLESNPVLEAFGNAKSVRNNNSSRFGKFVEIQFDQNGRISGAAIITYLLERSRVCQVSNPERNYHCFYMLCAAPSEDVKRYKLGNPRSFHYLNQSNCYELDGVDDRKEYIATRKAMEIVGISSEEQANFCTLQAGVSSQASGEGPVEEQVDGAKPVDDTDLWIQAVGGRKKGRVYGMGSEASVIHSQIGRAPPPPPPTPTSTPAAVDMTQVQQEIAEMFNSAMDNMVDQIVQRVSDIGSGSAAATPTHHDEQDPPAQD